MSVSDTYKFRKSNTLIDDLLEQLKKRFLSFPDEDQRHLVISVIRKGPHIIRKLKQYIQKDSPHPQTFDFITDSAIPFVDMNEYQSISIIDDAAFLGSTYDRITALALLGSFYSGADCKHLCINSLPLVKSKSSRLLMSYTDYDFIPAEGICEINPDDELFFTNSMVDAIHYDSDPFDIEMPIFRMPYNGEDAESIMNVICNGLERVKGNYMQRPYFYKLKRYNKSTGKDDVSYSLVLDEYAYNNATGFAPEFAKLRFIFDDEDKEVRISSYCFHSVDEDCLHTDSRLFTLRYDTHFWNKAIGFVRKNFASFEDREYVLLSHPIIKLNSSPLSPEEKLRIYKSEFSYHADKGLVGMINYTFSFLLMKQVFPTIALALGISENASITPVSALNTDNLELLIGKEFASRFVEEMEADDSLSLLSVSPPSTSKSAPVYPPDIKLQFENQLIARTANIDWEDDNAADMALSVLFSTMRIAIETQARDYGVDVFNRRKYGESYASMREFLLLQPIKGLRSEIMCNLHKGIDYRIDSGSIVPQYVRQPITISSYKWTRLFRAGENDDPVVDRILRGVSMLLRILQEEADMSIFTRNTIDFMVLYVARFFNDGRSLVGFPISYVFINDSYQAIVDVSNCDVESWHNLFDILLESGMLESVGASNYRLGAAVRLSRLAHGNALTQEEELRVSELANEAALLLKKLIEKNQNKREMLNWLYKIDYKTTEVRFKKLLNEVSVYNFDSDDDGLSHWHSLNNEFFNAYYRIPDFTDKALKQLIFKSEPIARRLKPLMYDTDRWDNLRKRFHALYLAMLLVSVRRGLYNGDYLPSNLKEIIEDSSLNSSVTINGEDCIVAILQSEEAMEYVRSIDKDIYNVLIAKLISSAKYETE